jgi:hypothetical protein
MQKSPISITAIGPARYRVNISASATTSHEVTLPGDYLRTLGLAAVPAEIVIEESFRFLLEREANTSILRTFPLPMIERYFLEFRAEIKRRLQP